MSRTFKALFKPLYFLAGVTALLCGTQISGVPSTGDILSGGVASTFACLGLLVFGLPHGTFDIELITRAKQTRRLSVAAVLTIYIACAAAMYALWRVDAVLALGAFLALSIVHFAEDWRDAGSPLLAFGMAVALLAAPVLGHHGQIDVLFTALTGDPRTAIFTDLLLMAGPPSLAMGVVALALIYQSGRRSLAIAGACALAALLVLPPLVGFAAFFCLVHSPMHFSEGLRRLGWTRPAQWAPVAIPVTALALALSAAVYALAPHLAQPMRVMSASFITLSVLVLPHMATPRIVAALEARRHRRGIALTYGACVR